MSAPPPKRYLATIRLSGGVERLRDVPLVVEWLRRFAGSDHEIAFRSNDGLLFGFLLNAAAPQFMRAEFEKCTGTRNGDELLIAEVGSLVDAVGFRPAAVWLRRH